MIDLTERITENPKGEKKKKKGYEKLNQHEEHQKGSKTFKTDLSLKGVKKNTITSCALRLQIWGVEPGCEPVKYD